MARQKQFAQMIAGIAGQTGKMEPRLEKAAAAIARREGAAAVTPQKIIAEYNRMSGAPGAQSFGPPQPRTAAEIRGAAETPTGRDPVDFGQRLTTDKEIRQTVGEFSPGFEKRAARGDVGPDEVLDMYGTGPLKPRPTPPIASNTPRMPAAPAPRPLGDRVDAVLRRLDDQRQPDINMMGMDQGSYIGWPDDAPMGRSPTAPERIAQQFDNITGGARRRPADPDYTLPLGIGAAAATAGVLSRMYPRDPGPAEAPVEADDTPALDNTDGTADLAAEATPPPEMPAEDPPFAAADLSEEQFTERFKRQYLEREASRAQQQPVDYSLEARKLIDQLNAMRRAAGGEVPEAQAMMQEIRRLQELGNQTRRATFVAAPGDDASRYFQQAQGLIDQLNAEYRTGSLTPNSPKARQVMAQVRQLQQAGDNLRNRRAG
jgi:hypothetical protein